MSEQVIFTQEAAPNQPSPEELEEFMLLMSLRLDDLLDDDDEHRFQDCMRRYAMCARHWQSWQQMHQELVFASPVEPPVNFVARVEVALVQQDRRRQLWKGVFFGALVLLLWGGVMGMGIAIGAYLLFNQGSWVGTLIHNLAFYLSALNQWLSTVRNALNAFLNTPQALGITLCYLALAAVALSLWVRFLRHTTMDAVSV
jgi:hypothetical protein